MGPFRQLAALLALAGVTSACVSIELPAAPLLVRVEVRARQDELARPLEFRLAHAQSAQALEHVLTLPSNAWGRAPGIRAHGLLALDGWEIDVKWSATSQPYPGARQDVLLLDVALP